MSSSKINNLIFIGLPNRKSYLDAMAQPQYLGYRYLTAVLRKKGYNVQIINVILHHKDLEGVLFSTDSKLVEKKISSIIISKLLDSLRLYDINSCVFGFTVSAQHVTLVIDAVNAIKKAYPTSTILLGGVFATLCAKEIISCYSQVNYILTGEAETSIISFLDALAGKTSLKSVKGLVYRSTNGSIIRNPPAQVVSNLDNLPLPAQDDIKFIYNRNNNKIRLSSVRGCYGKCSFCSINAFNKLICYSAPRMRSATNTVDEIDYLAKTYGIKKYVFVDPNFMASGRRGKQRAVDLGNELVSRKLDVSFKIDIRANDVEFTLMSHLKKAGLYGVEVGIESFDDNILKIFNKKTTSHQNIKAINILCKLGLSITISYIFYTPWTTIESVRKTLPTIKQFAKNPRIEWFPIFKTLKPVHGTELLEQIAVESKIRGNYLGYDYITKDKSVENLRHKHMAFNDSIMALLSNLPQDFSNIKNSVTAKVSFDTITKLLKGLSISYLDALLEKNSEKERECLKTFNSHKNALKNLYHFKTSAYD